MHKGHGRNISVGGGYAKQERKDLFKDMSGGYNAMGDSNSPNYRYDGNSVAQKYGPMDMSQAQANNLPPELVKAIKEDEEKGGKMTKKVTEMKKDPVPSMKSDSMLYNKGCISGSSKKRFKS